MSQLFFTRYSSVSIVYVDHNFLEPLQNSMKNVKKPGNKHGNWQNCPEESVPEQMTMLNKFDKYLVFLKDFCILTHQLSCKEYLLFYIKLSGLNNCLKYEWKIFCSYPYQRILWHFIHTNIDHSKLIIYNLDWENTQTMIQDHVTCCF